MQHWGAGGWNLCDFYCTVEWKQLLLHSWPVGMRSGADKLPGFDETSGLFQAHRNRLRLVVFLAHLGLRLSGCRCQVLVPVFSQKRRV